MNSVFTAVGAVNWIVFIVSVCSGCRSVVNLNATTYDQTLVSHPGYGRTFYGKDEDTCWYIDKPEGYALLLTADRFSLENSKPCIYDSLSILDQYGFSLGEFCGDIIFTTAAFVSCNISLHFTTDGTGENSGFSIRYSLIRASQHTWDWCIVQQSTTAPPGAGNRLDSGVIIGTIVGILVLPAVIYTVIHIVRSRRALQSQGPAQPSQGPSHQSHEAPHYSQLPSAPCLPRHSPQTSRNSPIPENAHRPHSQPRTPTIHEQTTAQQLEASTVDDQPPPPPSYDTVMSNQSYYVTQ